MRWPCCVRPRCRWRWSMTNMAISTASSRRDRSSARWPAPSPMTSRKARSRPASSARMAAGWCRARPMPTCCRDRIGVNMPDDRDYSTVAGFALSVLKKIPETGEMFKFDGYGSRWSTWTAARSTSCWSAGRKRQADRGRGGERSARRLIAQRLPNLTSIAVDVAAGEIVGLLDDPVALEAARGTRRAKRRALRPGSGDSLAIWSKRVMPRSIEDRGELGPDALQLDADRRADRWRRAAPDGPWRRGSGRRRRWPPRQPRR